MRLRRAGGFMVDHGPLSNARRAAFTARSISAAPPAAALANTSPVAGLMTSKISPDWAGTNFPSMKSECVRARKLPTNASGSDRVGETCALIQTPESVRRAARTTFPIGNTVLCTHLVELLRNGAKTPCIEPYTQETPFTLRSGGILEHSACVHHHVVVHDNHITGHELKGNTIA